MSADKPENKKEKVEATKPTEVPAKEAVIGATPQQDRWKLMEQAHYLEQDESATGLFHRPGEASPSTCKFGIEGLDDEPSTKLAWKPEDFFKDPGKTTKEVAKDIICRDKGHEDQRMHYLEDFNAFYTTDLSKYEIDPFVIAALTRNEIEHRKAGIDDAQDDQVKMFGQVISLEPDKASIGNQQMQGQNIKRLVNATDDHGKFLYPQLEPLRSDPVRKALEPGNGALVLGAYLQDTARRLEKGQDPIPAYDKAHKEQVRATIERLWASREPERRTDALIRSYNPGDGQVHVDNVRKHMQVIKSTVGKLFL